MHVCITDDHGIRSKRDELSYNNNKHVVIVQQQQDFLNSIACFAHLTVGTNIINFNAIAK